MSPDTADQHPPEPSMWIPLTIAAAFFMEGLDSTIIATSLPQIAATFKTTPSAVSGAITSYFLSLAIFIPVSGWLADRFGARRIYCTAIVIFTAASVLCGFATNMGFMVFARVLQGLGGAMMMPVSRTILARSFPKDQLVRAMSFMIIPGLIGPMLGPVIGGFITTYASWPWVFFINVPLGVLGLVMSLKFLKPFKSPRPARFDFPGFVIVAIAFGSIQIALDHLSSGGGFTAHVAVLGLVSALCACVYVFYSRIRQHPLLDLKIFSLRTFRISVVAGGAGRVGMAAPAFLLPILFQLSLGMSAFHSGLLTFLMAAGQITMRPHLERLLNAVGVRNAMVGCSSGMSLLIASYGFIRTDTPIPLIAVGLFVFGIFASTQASTLAVLAFSGVPGELTSRASTLAAVFQRFTMGLGTAVGAFLFDRMGGQISPNAFASSFFVVAAIQASAIIGFSRLKPSDGADLIGRGKRGPVSSEG